MKILTKMRLYTPATSIRNADSLLNRKLELNSEKLRSAQDALAKGVRNKGLLQKRIMKLQAKESLLIATKNLKGRFMISPPEDFNENTDIAEEKRKIYKNFQKTIDDLSSLLEKNMHSTEGMTLSMATKSVGEMLGIVRSLLTIVSKELIPMAHDGTALQGYYALKRDLQLLIENTQSSQKSLLDSIGKESVDVSGKVVNHNMLITADQSDGIQTLYKTTKSRLTILHTLLEISKTAGVEKISEEGTLTQEGKDLGASIKNSIRELLNTMDVSRSQSNNSEEVSSMLPFISQIDISEINLCLEREGVDEAKEKMELALGEELGADVISTVESEVEVDPSLCNLDEKDETESLLSNDEKSMKKLLLEKTVCCPFKHCTSTNDVIEVLERLSTITLEDGTPAIDMHNVCNLLIQTIKREINLGQKNAFVIDRNPGSRIYYKMGEKLDAVKEEVTLKSNVNFVGNKGELLSNYLSYGKDKVLEARDSYLLSVTRAVDSLTGILQSIEDKRELNILLHPVDDMEVSGEKQIDSSSKETPPSSEKEEQKELYARVNPSKRLRERENSRNSEYLVRYVEQITSLFEHGMNREEMIKVLGEPQQDSLFVQVVKAGTLNSIIERSGEKIVKKGLPPLLEWIVRLPEHIISKSGKAELLSSCIKVVTKSTRNISPILLKNILDEGLLQGAPQEGFDSEQHFQKVREEYRKKLTQMLTLLGIDSVEQEKVLDAIVILGDLYRLQKNLSQLQEEYV